MRPAPLLSLVLLVGCSQSPGAHSGTAASTPPPPSPPAASSPPATAAVRVDAAQAECVGKWLAGHGLDDYGNAKGTMYAGGTPTFDEKTGTSVDRWVLVARHRPEALQLCGVPLGP